MILGRGLIYDVFFMGISLGNSIALELCIVSQFGFVLPTWLSDSKKLAHCLSWCFLSSFMRHLCRSDLVALVDAQDLEKLEAEFPL